MFLGPWISMAGSKNLGSMGIAKMNKKDLGIIGELIEAGKVVPVVDRRYQLSEVAEAIRYLEEGHTQGKTIIAV